MTIAELTKEDQGDRAKYSAGLLSESSLWERDTKRLSELKRKVNSGHLSTSKDYYNAALVFQHGRNEKYERDLFSSEMAIKMMKKAIELDEKTNKWLLAAAIDRNLMIRRKPQIYGTQYILENNKWTQYEMDITVVSDTERTIYNVPTLTEQKNKLKRLNKSKLISKYQESKNEFSIIDFIRENQSQDTPYDLSWKGISEFGFQLKRLGQKAEAIRIFELGIEFYPIEYDLYHSLGLMLIEEGKKKEGVKLLEKSVQLNPNFKEGIRDLERVQEDKTGH